MNNYIKRRIFLLSIFLGLPFSFFIIKYFNNIRSNENLMNNLRNLADKSDSYILFLLFFFSIILIIILLIAE